MVKKCAQCGKSYTAQRSTSRFCSSGCRAKKSKGVPPVTELHAVPRLAAGGNERAVRAELEACGRADSYLGVAALTLAARMDGSEGTQNVAQLVKELRETMEKALAGAEKAGRLLEMRHGRKRDAG